MPVPPKTPERRQRSKAGKGPKRDLTLLPSRLAIPDPPPGLLATTAADWVELWRSEVGRMLRETDVPALRRLFHYRDEWARLHAVVRGDGFTPFVSGSTGQPRTHPIYEQMGKLEVQILALEDRFGLSVRQRVTLGASVVDTARSLDEYNAEFEARHAADRDDVDPRLDLATD